MMLDRLHAPYRRMAGLGLAGPALVLAIACGAPQKQAQQQAAPAGGEDVGAVKDAFDTDETGGFVPTPKTKEELEAARKAYSPFAGRTYPTHVYFGETHNHTANSGDAYMAGNTLSPSRPTGSRAARKSCPRPASP